MKRKNKLLFILALILLSVNVIFFFLPERKSQISFDENMFAVQDTSLIREISLKGEVSDVILTRSEDGWELNGRYAVDQGLRRLLFSILGKVKVKRPVADASVDGVTVDLDGKKFLVSGNATKTKTFFTIDGQSFEVEIPGYRDYLGGIFELHMDQWRDRLVYNGSWRTIQKLDVNYLANDIDDFQIAFSDRFFEIEGIDRIDSTLVVDYLNQFQYFQTNERISHGRFERYDSLSLTDPLAILTLESINYSTPERFFIYPAIANERFHLMKNSADELMIFDRNRVNNILLNHDSFKLKE
ncbi:MAG: hypothetical protein JXR03_05380 [Cyclobacteriaceae bacterium]